MKSQEIERLKKWFYLHRRPLPWREDPSPYEVWVSEVMLQQTQVTVVIPYFRKWMLQFPSVRALAEAEASHVIKIWEGLGYYSRARNLHEGARYLTKYHGGEVPEDPEALKKVKGIGPYTIGAIRSFAFKQKAAAVDGNVLRVLARYYGIEEPIDQNATRRKIETLTEELLPDKEPWLVMEALIELGALVCQKKARCEGCPLKISCLAHKKQQVHVLPKKGKKIPTTFLHRLVPIIQSSWGILLQQGAQGRVMADLWEFPYIELTRFPKNEMQGQTQIIDSFPFSLTFQKTFPIVSHGFTRYKATLYPYLFYASAPQKQTSYQWVPLKNLKQKPFSSGHRRILEHFLLAQAPNR